MIFDHLAVFLVEDEALVAMNLEDMLYDLGCRAVTTAMRAEQVERLLAGGVTCDVAIVDVNLGGRMIFPYAEQLRARGIPIVFATGYGRSGVPAEWQHCPILQKPYTEDQVAAALGEAASGGRAACDRI